MARIHPDVATSLPHLMITPRTRGEQDDSGFKSMVKYYIVTIIITTTCQVNEMTASQKAAAVQLYQHSLLSSRPAADQNQSDLPFGVEAVTYDEDDNEEFDVSQFMEEVTAEDVEDMEEESSDHIEITRDEDVNDNASGISVENDTNGDCQV